MKVANFPTFSNSCD